MVEDDLRDIRGIQENEHLLMFWQRKIAPREGALMKGGIMFARDRKPRHMAMTEVRIEVFMFKYCGKPVVAWPCALA